MRRGWREQCVSMSFRGREGCEHEFQEHEKRREGGMCEHEFQEEGRRGVSMRRGGTEGEH